MTAAEPTQAGKQLKCGLDRSLAFMTTHTPEGGQTEVVFNGEFSDDASPFWNMGDTAARNLLDGSSQQFLTFKAH